MLVLYHYRSHKWSWSCHSVVEKDAPSRYWIFWKSWFNVIVWHRISNKTVYCAKKCTNRRVSIYWKCIALVKGLAAFLQYLYNRKKSRGSKKSSSKLTFQLLGNVPGMAANNSSYTHDSHQQKKSLPWGKGHHLWKLLGDRKMEKFSISKGKPSH